VVLEFLVLADQIKQALSIYTENGGEGEATLQMSMI